MQSSSVFLDIAKYADFRWKKMLMSAELMGCVTCFIYFLDPLLVRWYNCANFHHFRICMTDFKEGGWLFSPIREQLWKGPSWIGLTSERFYEVVFKCHLKQSFRYRPQESLSTANYFPQLPFCGISSVKFSRIAKASRWLSSLAFFAKNFILDVWPGSVFRICVVSYYV